MAILEARFGTDLRLLPSLERTHSSRDPGNDLQVRSSLTGGQDLALVSGRDNLLQALILRLLTPAGALAALGHPDYGSRLHELIGELNTATNRNRVKMLALQALTAEPRVKRVVSLDVRQASDDRTRVEVAARDRTRVEVTARLEVVDDDTPLNLVFPFFFEGGAP